MAAELLLAPKVILVDFHADATSEKQALGFYLDGKVSAVLGTHTHVPTADERILTGGTALLTDVGMTGPYESIIGMRVDKVLRRFLLQTSVPLEVAKRDVRLAGAVVDIEGAPGLFGLTARRLLAKDPHPGEAHEVVIVRVRPDGDVKEKRGRCVWVGGVEWSLLALGEATRFRVREDGRVASVQATAELVE